MYQAKSCLIMLVPGVCRLNSVVGILRCQDGRIVIYIAGHVGVELGGGVHREVLVGTLGHVEGYERYA